VPPLVDERVDVDRDEVRDDDDDVACERVPR
jgi:hypothetical protein